MRIDVDGIVDRSTKDTLLAIERKLWTNNAAFYGATVTADAVLVFAGAGVISRDAAVGAIWAENARALRWAEVDIRAMRWAMPVEGVILLTYGVTARWAHQTVSIEAIATSAYVRRNGAWKLVFHQQTPFGDPAGAESQ